MLYFLYYQMLYIILILTRFISTDRLTNTGFTKCIYVNMNVKKQMNSILNHLC
jgi:hypothetical protein